MNSAEAAWNSLPSLDGLFSWIILTILGISTVVFVLDSVGLLPRFLQKALYRNRTTETLEVLRELGFDVDRVKRNNRAAKISEKRAPDTLEASALSLTQPYTLKKPVKVGRGEAVSTDTFINLMGATCNPIKALDAAQQLSALWRNVIAEASGSSIPDFDFVAAPKAGSPFIAYEFAKLHKKPLVLHNENPKFQPNDDFVATFDAEEQPPEGAVGIIVDDSTTGGRKAMETIEHLRAAGYRVSDFLVVFEPLTKKSTGRNAAARLANVEVRLHSMIKTE